MTVIITPREKIEEYHASGMVSQSLLKNLEYGVDKFLEEKEKRESTASKPFYFIIGSAVDTILTGEEGDFESLYHISKIEKMPSVVEQNMIEEIFKRKPQGSLSDHPGTILDVTQEFEWQPKYKSETKIEKIILAGSEYYSHLQEANGKTILSQAENNLIQEVVNSLRTNERTFKYFDRNYLSSIQNIKTYFQLPLYYNLDGVDCKSLLDMVVVGYTKDNKATFVQPIDLKTTSGYTIDFPQNAKTFRYDIQSAMYTDAFSNPTTIYPEGFPEIVDTTIIRNFTFVVESTKKAGKPLVYVATENFLNTGRFGIKTEYKKTKGYRELLEIYKYQEEKGWVEDKIVTESYGILDLDFN